MYSKNQIFIRNIRKSIFVLCSVSFLLVGCSSMPDWANPVEWYKGTKDWVVGVGSNDDTVKKFKNRVANKNFPKLSSVPNRPARANLVELKKLQNSLKSDRDAARYTERTVNRQKSLMGTKVINRKPLANPPKVSFGGIGSNPKKVLKSKTISITEVRNRSPLKRATSSQKVKVKKNVLASTDKNYLNITPQNKFVQANPFAIRFPSGVANRFSPAKPIAHENSNVERSGQNAVVLFDTGSSKLTVKTRKTIRRIANLFKKRGGTIQVIGHASSRTRDMSWKRHHLVNFNVSFDRAHAVGKQLKRLGVNPTAIEISAISDSKPRFSEVMPSEESRNRRVEIFLNN